VPDSNRDAGGLDEETACDLAVRNGEAPDRALTTLKKEGPVKPPFSKRAWRNGCPASARANNEGQTLMKCLKRATTGQIIQSRSFTRQA